MCFIGDTFKHNVVFEFAFFCAVLKVNEIPWAQRTCISVMCVFVNVGDMLGTLAYSIGATGWVWGWSPLPTGLPRSVGCHSWETYEILDANLTRRVGSGENSWFFCLEIAYSDALCKESTPTRHNVVTRRPIIVGITNPPHPQWLLLTHATMPPCSLRLWFQSKLQQKKRYDATEVLRCTWALWLRNVMTWSHSLEF